MSRYTLKVQNMYPEIGFDAEFIDCETMEEARNLAYKLFYSVDFADSYCTSFFLINNNNFRTYSLKHNFGWDSGCKWILDQGALVGFFDF